MQEICAQVLHYFIVFHSYANDYIANGWSREFQNSQWKNRSIEKFQFSRFVAASFKLPAIQIKKLRSIRILLFTRLRKLSIIFFSFLTR